MRVEYFKTAAEMQGEATRAARRTLRNSQPADPLAYRMKTVNHWKEWAKTEPLYGGPHSRALYRHPGFRRYLMPRLAATLKAREQARRQAHSEMLRLESEALQLKKALKKAGPLPLFD